MQNKGHAKAVHQEWGAGGGGRLEYMESDFEKYLNVVL